MTEYSTILNHYVNVIILFVIFFTNRYVREVTEASAARWVVVHMYQNRVEDCQLLARVLEPVAIKVCAPPFVLCHRFMFSIDVWRTFYFSMLEDD